MPLRFYPGPLIASGVVACWCGGSSLKPSPGSPIDVSANDLYIGQNMKHRRIDTLIDKNDVNESYLNEIEWIILDPQLVCN